jgi:hypothetical protein
MAPALSQNIMFWIRSRSDVVVIPAACACKPAVYEVLQASYEVEQLARYYKIGQ